VLLSLPDEDEGERGMIAELASRAREQLTHELDVPSPAQVTLRFHATADSYERATGRAWFTSGTVVAGELHLLPLALLRERGVLERTIRREMVHVLVDPVLSKRPLWVRDGAAAYFADAPGDVRAESDRDRRSRLPQARLSCPEDVELRQPVSIGALSNAYARARACFARQIASGKDWRDVK
jgi:hypothetical protein